MRAAYVGIYWFYRYLSGLGVDGKKFFWGSAWQFSLAVLKKRNYNRQSRGRLVHGSLTLCLGTCVISGVVIVVITSITCRLGANGYHHANTIVW